MNSFFQQLKVVDIFEKRSIRNDPDAGLCLNGRNKLYIFNSFLRMKLVLKFQEEVKLFTGSLEYDDVVAFICREFNIVPPSLHISFLDQDNDDITILSNEDIDVMQALFEGKEYVKVNVTGEVVAPLHKEEKVEEIQIKLEIIPVEEPKVDEPEVIEIRPAEIEEKPEQAVVVEEKAAEEPRCPFRGSKQWSHHHEERRRTFENVESYLNEAVAKLVDQRVKALIPCLKEQILNHEAKKVEPKGLVHEGTECKGCLVKPIVGIRYECPTCPEFSLCENCEAKIDHDHNLLKIKKMVEKKEEDRPGLGHCLKRLFKHGRHGHHGHRGRSSSSSREKCHWKGPHWAMRKLWGLSMMFGGKPEDYRSFVDENKHLRPRETFKKYADLQGLTEEDFKQRFIDMRCQKLANNFGKPAQEYRAFVEENYESRYRDLVCKLEEKGEKSDGRKCRWGKRYNFNDSCEKECSPKKEEVAKVEIEVLKEELKKEEPLQEEPNKKEKIQITDSMFEMPLKESPEVAREKGFILTQMQEVFGKENTKDYFKLINQHYKEGLQGVVQRWIEQLNLSQISK